MGFGGSTVKRFWHWWHFTRKVVLGTRASSTRRAAPQCLQEKTISKPHRKHLPANHQRCCGEEEFNAGSRPQRGIGYSTPHVKEGKSRLGNVNRRACCESPGPLRPHGHLTSARRWVKSSPSNRSVTPRKFLRPGERPENRGGEATGHNILLHPFTKYPILVVEGSPAPASPDLRGILTSGPRQGFGSVFPTFGKCLSSVPAGEAFITD